MAYKMIPNYQYGSCTIVDTDNKLTIHRIDRKIDNDNDTYITLWNEKDVDIQDTDKLLSEFTDYSCDINVKYKYRVNYGVDNTNGIEIADVSPEFDYEDIILYDNTKDGGAQLIRFNPTISSLKRNQSESITATLGSKYPIVRRNGDMDYYTFSLGGLISTLALKENYKNESQRTLEERDFRKQFVDALCDGKIKLFKSGPEGMMLVRVTGVSLTPETKLGRDIYSFTAIVTEVAEATITNMRKFNILSPSFKYFTVKIDREEDSNIYFVVRG